MKLRLIIFMIGIIIPMLAMHAETLLYNDDNNNIGYKFYTDTYSWDLGYGDAVAYAVANGYPTNIYIQDYIVHRFDKRDYIYNVVEIADNICSGKSSITNSRYDCNLSIPQFIRKIGSKAFYGCSGFKGVRFRNGGYYLKEIGPGAFMGCSGIETTNLNECDNLEIIGNSAFKDCINLKYADIPINVKSIEASAFENCQSLVRLSFLQKGMLKEIGGSAFANCSGFMVNSNLPEGLTKIGPSAFYNTSISGFLVLPSSLEEIGTMAFYHCKNLHGSLVIPDKISEIMSHTFAGCENISGNLIIGENVNYIGDEAFYNLGNVSAVVVKSTTPPRGYRSPFSDILYKTATLFVPKGTLAEYSRSEIWGNFTHIEELNYTPPTRLEATIGKRTLASDKKDVDDYIVIEKGTKVPVQSVVTPSNPINDIVDWHSHDTLTCVIKDGYIEMRGDKSTLVTATTNNNLSVQFRVQGGTPVSTIELPDTIVVELGKSKAIQYNVLPSGYHYGGYDWEIDNPEVAEINTRYTSITGKALGCTNLKVAAGDGWGANDSCVVKVIPPLCHCNYS